MSHIDFYNQLEEIYTENGGRVGLSSNKEQEAFHRQAFSFLNAFVDTSNLVIHDAGCGYGDLIKSIGINKDRYFGTESRASAFAKAKSEHPQYKFYNCDLTNHPPSLSDITVAIGTFAFLRKTDASKIFHNLEAQTKRALLITCWGAFDSVSGTHKKEAKLTYEWLKGRMESGELRFKRSAMVTSDSNKEAMFLFFNE